MPATKAPATAPRKVAYHASWAEYYTSLSDLKAHADIAVLGTVSSVGAAEQLTANGPVYSTVTLDVNRSLWSRAKAAPASVSFVETGGTYQGVTYELDDDPLYEVGDQVVMFFTESAPGKYRVTGGPTGRFTISGGVVKSAVKDGVQIAAGTSESSFCTNVQND